MRVAVLGAGVVGTTTAWYLAKAGHEVTVLERHSAAALETSFANGGQISVSHAEPWANPNAPWKILKWLGREDAPLLFRLRADWRQWQWGLRFLLECRASRTRENTRQLLALGLYSRERLRA
ncbi:MAG: FAD-dependent oxidoreductase, partial [Burkholderiales bacterium]|nr:FAD-dependent oxidoreductase [Burkholderiales bacterium]